MYSICYLLMILVHVCRYVDWDFQICGKRSAHYTSRTRLMLKNNIKVVLVCVEYRPTKPSRRSDPRIIISTSTRPLRKQASLAQANEQLSYEDLQLSCPLHSERTQRIPNAKIKAKDRFGQYIPNTDENKHNIYKYKYIYS